MNNIHGEQLAKKTRAWLAGAYARIPTASDDGLLREHDKEWNDHLRSLSRQSWTPSMVPANRRGLVVFKVRKSAPARPDSDPTDDVTSREAVEQRYRKATSASARAVTVGGAHIAPGLAYRLLSPGPAC